MKRNSDAAARAPRGRLGNVLLNLLITLIAGAVYFYVAIPAINLQSGEFYSFVFMLCMIYLLCALVTSGFRGKKGEKPFQRGQLKEYLTFIKQQCLPVGILLIAMVVVIVVGQIVSLPIFRAGAYRDLLTVENGEFTQDISQISFNEIPTLDRDSANYLGDRQMGTLSDMVSQFDYSNSSTQINYQGRPVRVAPIAYADLIKWFTNRGEGLPAYVVVDMVTQEAQVVRLPEGQGMKYSFSEPLNRNILRHLRFQYPTFMFSTPRFEIDEEGNPWWIAPKVVKTIGLFGGTDIDGAVLCNAITGESQYYAKDEIPTWVDNVYTPELIMQQYDYHGTLINGFINSVLGQRDVTITTQGYNYIAINDDVYVYTGVTSANADQSNLGFLLSNQRTKETKFYDAPGATEEAAKVSAQGVVQDLGYIATFPLLLNIADQPTYFMALKGNDGLVKMYAMVNVQQYNIVETGGTVAECEANYRRTLADNGLISDSESEAAPSDQEEASGIVAEIRTAVLDGNSYYFLRLEGQEVFYAVNAAENPLAVILNAGDQVTITYTAGESGSILTGTSVTRAGETDVSFTVSEEDAAAPAQPDAETAPAA